MPSLAAGLFAETGAGGEAAGLQSQANREAIAEIRRQFGVTQENVQPFLQAGQGALPGLTQGATVGGFGERLGEIFGGGALDPLIQERTRAVQGGLAAGGLRRSGAGLRELADVPTGLGFQLEQMLTGRGQQLAGAGLQGALGLGQLGGQAAGQQAGLFQGIGQAQAQGSLADAQARAARNQQFIQGAGELGSFAGGFLPPGGISSLFGAGAGAGAAGGVGGATAASIGASSIPSLFFSDPNLKENVEEIGEINGLKIYEWDWIPEAKETIVGLCSTIGFMADEVKKAFPGFVHKYAGYDVVDYPGLLNRLEVNHA